MGVPTLFLTLLLPLAAAAHSPHAALDPTLLAKAFPLERLGALALDRKRPEAVFERAGVAMPLHQVTLPVGRGRVTVHEDSRRDIVLTGPGWSLDIGGLNGRPGGLELWRADLDGDGRQDLVGSWQGAGDALTPGLHMFAVLFDGHGLPLHLAWDAYDPEGEGAAAGGLLKLDADGRASLLHTALDEGHWVSCLYRAEAGRWVRVAGRRHGLDWPSYVKNAEPPAPVPCPPPAKDRPNAPDLSCRAPFAAGAFAALNWGDRAKGRPLQMVLEGKGGLSAICSPISWYGPFTLVLESPRLRRVLTHDADEAALKRAFTEAQMAHARVACYGMRVEKTCTPGLVWVRVP